MKAAFSFLSIIISLAIIWVLYVEYFETNRGPGSMLQEQERAEVPRATPAPQPASRQPAARQPARPTRPQASRPAQPMRSKRNDIYAVAKQNKVSIVAYRESGNSATVVCQARQHNQMGDFLDNLTRRGIVRDFDFNNKDFTMRYDKQQRRIYQCKYVLKW